MSTKLPRAAFMTEEDKRKMGNFPRTHQNCFKLTGKNRPGKTRSDKEKRGV